MAEAKITFLLGAGASANALPLSDEFADRMQETLKWLKSQKLDLSSNESFDIEGLNKSKHEMQQEFYSSMEWLFENTKLHASVDTFAKKLYITRKWLKLIELKVVLSCFFILEQSKVPIDKRYDTYFASLTDHTYGTYMLPPHVKIITWNYDFQLEKAFSAYSEKDSLYRNQDFLNVFPSDVSDLEYDNRFSIFKLNGTTGMYIPDWNEYNDIVGKLYCKIDIELIEMLIKGYSSMLQNHKLYKPLLRFAWEENILQQEATSIIRYAKDATKDTDILVIIGYSFPFFNRIIDRDIIQNMKNLSNVYFQAPKGIATNYRNRFTSIRRDIKTENLILIEDEEQFYIPYEL